MNILGITSVVELSKSIISRIWPDPNDQAQHLLKLAELEQEGDLAELNAYLVGLQGQLEINKVEAGHKSLFVAGWRPFIGWVGGFSLAYAGILDPLMRFISSIAGYDGEFPSIDTASTITILMGMLGIGSMRSYDKKNKTQTDKIN
jgi:hypothetical protein